MTTTPGTMAGAEGGGGGGGGGAVKEKMNKLRAQVMEMDERTAQLEREREEVEDYISQKFEQRQDMLIQYEETEEKLRKSEERLKALTEQVRDAEVFLKESTNFHRFLSQDSVGEDKINQLQHKLDACKEKYDEDSKQCRKAEKRKVKLTRQNESANNKLKSSLKRIEALKLKLEYGRIDEARKNASCQKQMQIAEECTSRFQALDASLKDVVERKAKGYDRVVTLKEKILALEEELDEVKRNRIEVELRTRDLKTYSSMNAMY